MHGSPGAKGESIALSSDVPDQRSWRRRLTILLRNSLGSEMFLDRDGIVCAALDGGVIDDEHAQYTGDGPDTCDNAACWNILSGIHLMSGQR